MRDIPVILDGYKLTVVEPPTVKTRTDERGREVPVLDREGVTQFVVSVFAKQRAKPGQRAPKGEEIKVTLATDPGPGFGEDTQVALVGATISPYQMENRGQVTSGLAFKAQNLAPAVPAPVPAPRPEK